MASILDLGKIKLDYKGAWSSATTYEPHDVVLQNGALWLCTAAVTPPSITTKNFKAPGFRDRTTSYGPQTSDDNYIKSFKVTKENISGVGLRFHFDRIGMKQLTLVRGRRYRFYLNDSTFTGGTITSLYSSATLNPTTITCASTASLVAGQQVYATGGTGRFADGTTVLSVTNGTTFVVSAAPTVAFNGATAVYTIPFALATSADGTTYTSGVTTYGTNGRDGWLEIKVPFDAPDTLYYKQPGVSSIGGTGALNIVDGWEGWKYWENLTEGFKYRGQWSLTTQYYQHDVVIDNGNTFIALQDSFGAYPSVKGWNTGANNSIGGTLANVTGSTTTLTCTSTTGLVAGQFLNIYAPTGNAIGELWQGTTVVSVTNATTFVISMAPRVALSGASVSYVNAQYQNNRRHGYWKLLSGANRARERINGLQLMNKAPLGWPYKHTHYEESASYGNYQWIAQDGRVWSMGTGTNNSGAFHTNSAQCYAMEVPLLNEYWWQSRDNNPETNVTGQNLSNEIGSSANGRKRLLSWGHGVAVTPHGERPKCIQIVHGYAYTMYLMDNGIVLKCGTSAQGEGGWGEATDRYISHVQGLENRKIIKIDASYRDETLAHHCGALDDEGNLYTWGYNSYGQLGNGDTNNKFTAYRIPREYFNNENIVDFCFGGNEYGWCYARTEKGNLYSWGYNGIGQLGVGDTNNYYRPKLVSSWDPVANNGIVKMMCVGNYTNGSFILLDGNGYIWTTGYNGYGICCTGDTVNKTTLTRTTQANVAGACVDFWASAPNTYGRIWFRVTSGATYVVGYASYYGLGTGANTTVYVPTLCPGLTNVRDVYNAGTYSDSMSVAWLLDDGRVFTRGYENYTWSGNQDLAQHNQESNGSDYRAALMPIPGGSKVAQIYMWCNANGTTQFGPHFTCILEDGRVMYSGGCGVGTNDNRQFLGGNYYTFNSSQPNLRVVSMGR